MTDHLHPGPHLDADQLAAFAEGALTAREREESLLHLASCADCRRVVFVAQEPLPVADPVVPERHVPFWRRRTPLLYACALIVSVVAVLLSLRPEHPAAPPAAIAHVAPPPVRVDPEQTHLPQPATPSGHRSVNAATVRSHPPAPPPPITVAPAVAQDTVSAAPALSQRASGASSQELPVNGRNLAASSEPLSTLNSRLRSSEPTLPPADGPLTLRIEHGQTTTGGLARVSGAVLDPTGASVAGATVTLRQASGVVPRQVKTDGQGSFTLAAVPAGRYDLQIAAPGFQQVNREIDLQASDLALLTSQLPVGSVSQTVEVTASTPMLQSESASVAMVATVVRLPRGHTAAETVYRGKLALALDQQGTVYLSTNHGKRWKKVKAKWPGKIIRIESADADAGFEITTDANTVWLSEDGKQWRQQP